MQNNFLLVLLAVFCAWGGSRVLLDKHTPLAGSDIFEFTRWSSEHGKSYLSPAEKDFRARVYIINQQTALKMNAETGSEGVFGATMFSDLTNEEFISKYTGSKVLDPNAGVLTEEQISELTKETQLKQTTTVNIDWRSRMGRVRKSMGMWILLFFCCCPSRRILPCDQEEPAISGV